MVGKPILEIPIYRCSREQHYKECKKKIEQELSNLREPPNDEVKVAFDDIFRTPWNYNEVICWLIIYPQGLDLVGEEWRDRHERAVRNGKRHYQLSGANVLRIRTDRSDTSQQIFQKLMDGIDYYIKLHLKNRYADTSKLKAIAPFVDWRALMDNEYTPNNGDTP